jgi:hypothetical protein
LPYRTGVRCSNCHKSTQFLAGPNYYRIMCTCEERWKPNTTA